MTRHQLRQLLGGLWLTAAALQAQPKLFTATFAHDVISPGTQFEPGVIAAPVRLAAHVIAWHPAAWDALFVAVELGLAVALLVMRNGRRARWACVGSAAWALSVWWVGEAAGGLLTRHAALTTGAPGAALLYAALSLLALPPQQPGEATRALVNGRATAVTWAAVWLLGAALTLLPGQASGLALGDQISMGAMMSPGPVSRPEMHLANWLGTQRGVGAVMALALAAVFIVVGVAPLRRRHIGRHAVFAGLVLCGLFWVVAQGFGGIGTGTATDVGAAPALALLGVVLLHSAGVDRPARDRSTARAASGFSGSAVRYGPPAPRNEDVVTD